MSLFFPVKCLGISNHVTNRQQNDIISHLKGLHCSCNGNSKNNYKYAFKNRAAPLKIHAQECNSFGEILF